MHLINHAVAPQKRISVKYYERVVRDPSSDYSEQYKLHRKLMLKQAFLILSEIRKWTKYVSISHCCWFNKHVAVQGQTLLLGKHSSVCTTDPEKGRYSKGSLCMSLWRFPLTICFVPTAITLPNICTSSENLAMSFFNQYYYFYHNYYFTSYT